MEELITISNDNGEQKVYARELYMGLGLDKSQWSRWSKKNIRENEFFRENIDWVGVRHNVEGTKCKTSSSHSSLENTLQ